jgi:hypothetical protein
MAAKRWLIGLVGVAPVPSHDLRLDAGDPRVELDDRIGDHPQHPARHVRHAAVLVIPDNRDQRGHIVQTLRRDEAKLRQMSAERIGQHGAAEPAVPARGASPARTAALLPSPERSASKAA